MAKTKQKTKTHHAITRPRLRKASAAVKRCKRISELCLIQCEDVTEKSLSEIIKNLDSSLESLYWYGRITPEKMSQLAQMKVFKHLHLNRWFYSRKEINKIRNQCPDLKINQSFNKNTGDYESDFKHETSSSNSSHTVNFCSEIE